MIPVPAAEAVAVNAWITLLDPFLPLAQVDEGVLDELEEFFAAVTPFAAQSRKSCGLNAAGVHTNTRSISPSATISMCTIPRSWARSSSRATLNRLIPRSAAISIFDWPSR